MTEADFLVYASYSLSTLSSILVDLKAAYKILKEEFSGIPDYHPNIKRHKGMIETYEIIIEVVTKLVEIKRKLITEEQLHARLLVQGV